MTREQHNAAIKESLDKLSYVVINTCYPKGVHVSQVIEHMSHVADLADDVAIKIRAAIMTLSVSSDQARSSQGLTQFVPDLWPDESSY